MASSTQEEDRPSTPPPPLDTYDGHEEQEQDQLQPVEDQEQEEDLTTDDEDEEEDDDDDEYDDEEEEDSQQERLLEELLRLRLSSLEPSNSTTSASTDLPPNQRIQLYQPRTKLEQLEDILLESQLLEKSGLFNNSSDEKAKVVGDLLDEDEASSLEQHLDLDLLDEDALMASFLHNTVGLMQDDDIDNNDEIFCEQIEEEDKAELEVILHLLYMK